MNKLSLTQRTLVKFPFLLLFQVRNSPQIKFIDFDETCCYTTAAPLFLETLKSHIVF